MMQMNERQLRKMVRSVLESSQERRQLRRDVVTRTHPLKLIAQTAYDLVTKTGYDPLRYAFTMTSIAKLGINPMSRYNTPVGIYAYPTTLEMVDKLLGGTYRKMGEKVQKDLSARPEAEKDPERALYDYRYEEHPELPFAGDQPYINFFELTDLNGVFYTSVGMSSDRYKAAIDALYSWFKANVQDSDHLDTFKKLLTGAQQYNKVNTRGVAVQALSADISDYQRLATIWTLSRALAHFKGGQNYTARITAGKFEGGTPAISSIWRSLLLIAGVRTVVDDAGAGLIHKSEKTQLVVLDPALIRNIAQFNNKTPARGGTVPRSAEMLKADIAEREAGKTKQLGALTAAISNANKHVLEIINGQASSENLRYYLTIMNSAKDLSPIRQSLDVPKLIESFRVMAGYKTLNSLMEITAFAHGVTGSQELIDILLDHLILSNPFTGLLQDTLPYANSLSRSADPGRRGRFMRAVVKGYIERTKDKAADADIAASAFLISLAKSGDVSHESIGAFNLSTFIETVMPMIKSMYGDDREAIRDLMNEISIAFRYHKKFKDPEDGPAELKKKSFEKMKAAASNIGSLMPTEDKYGNIRQSLGMMVYDMENMLKLAEEKLSDPAQVRAGAIDQLLTISRLAMWTDAMWSNIKYHVGLNSPTGTALSDLLSEYKATCSDIVNDSFDVFETLNQIKLKLGDKAFSEDGNEYEYSESANDLFFDALKNHQRSRINRVKQALEELVSGTESVLAAKQVDSKKARAEVGLYESRLRRIIREELLREIDIEDVGDICMTHVSTHIMNTCYIGGDKFHLKFSDESAEFSSATDPSLQVLVEWLAYKVYELYPGVDIPEKIELVYDKNRKRVGIATRSVDGRVGYSLRTKELAQGLSAGVYVDVFLANWDVGNLENIMVRSGDSRPVRIDPGGALTFRARGAKKGRAFSDYPGELETMIAGTGAAAEIFRHSDLRHAARTFNSVPWGRIESHLRKCNDEIVQKLTSYKFDDLLSQWSSEFDQIVGKLRNRHREILANIDFMRNVS